MNTNTDINDINTSPKYQFTLLAGLETDSISTDSRVCRMVWKLTPAMKEKGITTKRESLGAVIPTLKAPDVHKAIQTNEVMDWIRDRLTEVQDSLIREVLESAGNTVTEVYGNEIGLEQIVSRIVQLQTATRATSSRLSAAGIKEWFMRHAPVIAEAVAAKTGLPATSGKVGKVVEAFADNMALLAGKKRLPLEKAEQLVKALDIIAGQEGETDTMVDTLLERIEVLTAIPDDIDIGDLL